MHDTLAYAIVGHLVGDYLLQNDWQASGKKRSSWICAIHCLIWTFWVVLFAGWYSWPVDTKTIIVPLVLFTTHFLQDRWGFIKWYMLKMGQEKFASPPR
jgi:Protein of unknown function (DUF3307)